jgi:hypothetical protein
MALVKEYAGGMLELAQFRMCWNEAALGLGLEL